MVDKENPDNVTDYPLSLSIESKRILKNIGLWSDSLEIAPIKKIKVLNSDKFGSINIDHKEIGLPTFGSVLSNKSFLSFLHTTMLNENGNQLIDDFVVKVSENAEQVEVTTKNGKNFKSKFLINCTGDSNLNDSINFFEGDEFNIFTGFCSKKFMKAQFYNGLTRMALWELYLTKKNQTLFFQLQAT